MISVIMLIKVTLADGCDRCESRCSEGFDCVCDHENIANCLARCNGGGNIHIFTNGYNYCEPDYSCKECNGNPCCRSDAFSTVTTLVGLWVSIGGVVVVILILLVVGFTIYEIWKMKKHKNNPDHHTHNEPTIEVPQTAEIFGFENTNHYY